MIYTQYNLHIEFDMYVYFDIWLLDWHQSRTPVGLQRKTLPKSWEPFLYVLLPELIIFCKLCFYIYAGVHVIVL